MELRIKMFLHDKLDNDNHVFEVDEPTRDAIVERLREVNDMRIGINKRLREIDSRMNAWQVHMKYFGIEEDD